MADRQAGRAPTGPAGPGPGRRPRGGRIRRADLRRGPKLSGMAAVRAAIAHPASVPVALIALALTLLMTVSAVLARWSVGIEPGMVADEAVTARVDFRVENEERTRRRADLPRSAAERVYVLVEDVLPRLEEQLMSLPQAVAGAASLEQVSPALRERYELTEERLSELRRQAENMGTWQRRVSNLIEGLREWPVLPREEVQEIVAGGSGRVQLRSPQGVSAVVSENVIDMDDAAELRRKVSDIARRAGMWGAVREVVVDRIVRSPVATYEFDKESTEAARAATEVIYDEFAEGELLVRRGERLTSRQHEVLSAERDAYAAALEPWRVSLLLLGLWGGAAAIVVGLGGYLFAYYPRLVQRPWRTAALTGLVGLGIALAVWVGVTATRLAWLGLGLSVALPAMALVTAYGRRLALAATGVLIIWLGIALELPAVSLGALALVAGIAAWRLVEIRSRGDVVRATLWVAGSAAAGAVLAGLVTRPAMDGMLREVALGGFFAGVGAFAAGSLTMFLMPTIERVFDVTTGMTLGELRDPKQPLLRKLQQRAPGTYNHSLNVATIAESAARAIGADGLHLYVGALYHDVGKLSKPEYFVENQPRGLNKHDKLSPAMSLLVIMGHVKDGLELAREYGLPRSLHHYIESHHGETLVSYFYHQAKLAAASSDTEGPSEIEYRYPGPKPRTKEAAILMLCDAVEGATRAMSEPTPSRISALVHDMAMARLHDGQFDECELTFAELHRIESAITKSLSSIFHGRIAYPGDTKKQTPRELPESRPSESQPAPSPPAPAQRQA